MNTDAVKAYWWASINQSLREYQDCWKAYQSGNNLNRNQLVTGMEAALADAVAKLQIYRKITTHTVQ